jgi:hypothetical protein
MHWAVQPAIAFVEKGKRLMIPAIGSHCQDLTQKILRNDPSPMDDWVFGFLPRPQLAGRSKPTLPRADEAEVCLGLSGVKRDAEIP